jgi:RNA polymerase sigma-70 factor (ECF subfamily)
MKAALRTTRPGIPVRVALRLFIGLRVPRASAHNARMNPSGAPAAGFHSTQWSVVLAARSDPASRRAALEQLCRNYWPPVYSYLRRRGHSPADAEDTTQAFFAHLLGGDFFDRPDPERGRFRGYLVGALRQFVSHEQAHAGAHKRGGGVTFVDFSNLDTEREYAAVDHAQLDPSEAYELSWAVTLLGAAMRRLEAEQRAAGSAEAFVALQPMLHSPPAAGDYERASAALGTSRATIAVWLHRLTRRLAELVKLEVAATLENPADAGQELQHLLQVFRR